MTNDSDYFRSGNRLRNIYRETSEPSFESLSKKKLERYSVPIKRPNDQLLYHRTLEHAHKNIFRGSNVHNVLVVDFSRDLYMMHTRFQEKEDSIPDCTHFCQRINGVPFQYAKRILELISSGKFDRVG